MRRAYRGTMCSENWRCFRGSINYVTMEDWAGRGGRRGRGGKWLYDVFVWPRARARVCLDVCGHACTRWSKSTVLEACDIRFPGVIDTERRDGVQLDAPVILDSPLIYGLRREKGDSHRIRIRNERRRVTRRLFELFEHVLDCTVQLINSLKLRKKAINYLDQLTE